MKPTIRRLTLACISLIFFWLILTVQGYAIIDPQTAVGIWLFDEGEGDVAKDSSDNGNDGKLVNDPEWVEGKFGKALKFDGEDDYVDCGTDDSLNPTPITILVWVLVEERSSGQRSILVRRDYAGANAYQFINWPADAGKVRFSFWTGNSEKAVDTEDVIPLKEWCHVATTYDGKEAKIYFNGVESGTADVSGDIDVVKNVKTTIGASNQGKSESFLGIIDEVAVFNVALTENDINQIMTKGFSAVSPSGKLATAWGKIKADVLR